MKSNDTEEAEEAVPSFYKNEIYRSPPLKLKLLRMYIKILNIVYPRYARKYVMKLFITPRVPKINYDVEYQAMKIRKDNNNSLIELQGEEIFVHSEGENPQVLLIYGWESSLKRLITIIEGLRNKGIGFVTFDLPGHGLSPSFQNDAVLSSKIASDLLRSHPTIDTIIGHSFGGGVGYLALESEHEIKRLITIGSPTKLSSVVDPFFLLLDISPKLQEKFLDEISNHTGREFRDYDLTTIQTKNNFDLFVIHDTQDANIPYTDAIRMKDKYKDRCRLLITNGLGHRKIMHDPDTINQIINTIQ